MLVRVLPKSSSLAKPSFCRCSIEMMDELGWCLAWFRPIIRCVIRKLSYRQKIRVLPSGTLPQALDLKKFRQDRSIVEMCYHLSSTKVDAQSMINWTVVGQF